MVVVGLAAVLDSVLEDDGGLTFVAPPFFCFGKKLLLPHLASWRVVDRDGKPPEMLLFSQVGRSQVDFASYFTPK